MSVRENAPYEDAVEDDGCTLIYEGHDVPRSVAHPHPKLVDQPSHNPGGALSQNGRFYEAAHQFKEGLRSPEQVRVYEKLKPGIWSYNGIFNLTDAWQEQRSGRTVFKFKLVLASEQHGHARQMDTRQDRRRLIPSHIKLEVWKRDRARCVVCGATDELHFDHIVPFSKGGTSLTAANVQLLCARHNLQKRDRIE